MKWATLYTYTIYFINTLLLCSKIHAEEIPTDIAEDLKDIYIDLNHKALERASDRDFDQAIALLEKVLFYKKTLNLNDNFETQYNIAVLQLFKRETKLAITNFNKITHQPIIRQEFDIYVCSLLGIGVSYFYEKSFDKSTKHFQEAERLINLLIETAIRSNTSPSRKQLGLVSISLFFSTANLIQYITNPQSITDPLKSKTVWNINSRPLFRDNKNSQPDENLQMLIKENLDHENPSDYSEKIKIIERLLLTSAKLSKLMHQKDPLQDAHWPSSRLPIGRFEYTADTTTLDIIHTWQALLNTEDQLASTRRFISNSQADPLQVATWNKLIDNLSEMAFNSFTTPERDALTGRLLLIIALLNKGRSLDDESSILRSLHRSYESPSNRDLLDKLITIRHRQASLFWAAKSDSNLKKTLADINDETLEIEDRLSQIAHHNRERSRPQPEEAISAISNKIKPHQCLITYIKINIKKPGHQHDHYVAIAYSNNLKTQIEYTDLGDAESIDRLTDTFIEQISVANSSKSRIIQSAKELHEKLIKPLPMLVRSRVHLYISPDGELHRIPFSALHDGTDFLINTKSITYINSGNTLFAHEHKSSNTSLAIFANPNFSSEAPHNSPATKIRSLLASGSTFTLRSAINDLVSLPGTEQEAKFIYSLFPFAQLYLGDDASETTLLAQRAPAILHIATHGIYVNHEDMAIWRKAERSVVLHKDERTLPFPELPMARSAIVLAGAKLTEKAAAEDGIVTAQDIVTMDLWGTQLVVLSACQTALGKIGQGWQGQFGLQRAFQIAGAETVVTSLWKVADQQTTELMVNYYRSLLRGAGRAEAMRIAAQTIRQRHPHPYYWAPFIVTGRDGPLRGFNLKPTPGN